MAFSVISLVLITLLGVFQVTYLKDFFRKKKIIWILIFNFLKKYQNILSLKIIIN